MSKTLFPSRATSESLNVPLKSIILFALFWEAIGNLLLILDFSWIYTFFLAYSLLGIAAVLLIRPIALSYYSWIRFLVDIIQFISVFVNIVNVSPPSTGAFFGLVIGFIIFWFLEAFIMYCIVKYWDCIREGEVALSLDQEAEPFVDPFVERE